jgi:hypothetical protein
MACGRRSGILRSYRLKVLNFAAHVLGGYSVMQQDNSLENLPGRIIILACVGDSSVTRALCMEPEIIHIPVMITRPIE